MDRPFLLLIEFIAAVAAVKYGLPLLQSPEMSSKLMGGACLAAGALVFVIATLCEDD